MIKENLIINVFGMRFRSFYVEDVKNKVFFNTREVTKVLGVSRDILLEMALSLNEKHNTNNNYFPLPSELQDEEFLKTFKVNENTHYLITLDVILEYILTSPLKIGIEARYELAKGLNGIVIRELNEGNK